jgi:dihydroxy-acid dehydratase
MGAASVDIPTIGVSGGPMLRGYFRGKMIGSGTNLFRMNDDLRAGKIGLDEFHEAEACMHRSHGHCMVMGTASTMASMVEALGVGLPGNAAIPAVDARRYELARLAGRRSVALVREDIRLSSILTRPAFENAIRTLSAIGGSTNAIVHLIAIAGRIGVPLTLDDFEALGSDIDCLLNLMPSGDYLMEDFFEAGGLPAVLRELLAKDRLTGDAITVNGKTIGENCSNAPCWRPDVIHSADSPFKAKAGLKVLRGNLAPDGAIIKPSAAAPELFLHTGRAVVFDTVEDLHRRIDDPDLDVDEHSVLVLRNCGPKGYPGMAEVGNLPLPRKLIERGVTDMVRISDARMSGTAFGAVVLHVAPEAFVGGPLALVQDGDTITLDVAAGRLDLHVSDEILQERRACWQPPATRALRGYAKLYQDSVLQADRGADFDFLVGKSGDEVPRHGH